MKPVSPDWFRGWNRRIKAKHKRFMRGLRGRKRSLPWWNAHGARRAKAYEAKYGDLPGQLFWHRGPCVSTCLGHDLHLERLVARRRTWQ